MSLLKALRGSGHGFAFDRNVTYWMPYDLSVTYGSIFENVKKWIKNDLKGILSFKHVVIQRDIIANKDQFWNTGILMQAKRPCLNLQFNIDHTFENDAYSGPTFNSIEGGNYIDDREFHYRVLAFEHEDDPKNNLDIRLAFKSVHVEIQAGIVDISLPKLNNIAHFWHTKRNAGKVYDFRHMVDFKIPEEVMNLIFERFPEIDKNNHHDVLRFLNKNAFVSVYYGMSGYDGKFYYFLRYVCNSLIKAEDMNNPEAWAEEGQLTAESYTIDRSFSVDVMIPMYLSFSSYGDRIVLKDPKQEIDDKWKDIDNNRASGGLSERYIEIERVFKEKHLIKEITLKWEESDLVKLPDGSKISKRIDLEQFLDLDNDRYLQKLVAWAKDVKGYKYLDLFNVQIYQHSGMGIQEIHKHPDPLKKVTEINSEEEYESLDKHDLIEKENYIKNLKDFYIVDLKPDLVRELYVEIYLDMAIRNEYEYETKNQNIKSHAVDDLGYDRGYGHSVDDEYNDKV